MTHNKTNNIDNQYKSTDSQTQKRIRMAIDVPFEIKKEFKAEANRIGLTLSEYTRKVFIETLINEELKQRRKGNSLYDLEELIEMNNRITAKEERKVLTAKGIESVKKTMVAVLNVVRRDPDTVDLFNKMLEEFIQKAKTRYQKV